MIEVEEEEIEMIEVEAVEEVEIITEIEITIQRMTEEVEEDMVVVETTTTMIIMVVETMEVVIIIETLIADHQDAEGQIEEEIILILPQDEEEILHKYVSFSCKFYFSNF